MVAAPTLFARAVEPSSMSLVDRGVPPELDHLQRGVTVAPAVVEHRRGGRRIGLVRLQVAVHRVEPRHDPLAVALGRVRPGVGRIPGLVSVEPERRGELLCQFALAVLVHGHGRRRGVAPVAVEGRTARERAGAARAGGREQVTSCQRVRFHTSRSGPDGMHLLAVGGVSRRP
jgi:hypothetical protein